MLGAALLSFGLFHCARGGAFEGRCTADERAAGGVFDDILTNCPLQLLDARKPKKSDYDLSEELCAGGCNCFSMPGSGMTSLAVGQTSCGTFQFEIKPLAGSLYIRASSIGCASPSDCCPSVSCRYKCDSSSGVSCGNQLKTSPGKKVANASSGSTASESSAPGGSSSNDSPKENSGLSAGGGSSNQSEGSGSSNQGNESSDGDDSSDGLGTEAIAGIVSGAVAVIGVLIAAAALYYQKRSAREDAAGNKNAATSNNINIIAGNQTGNHQ